MNDSITVTPGNATLTWPGLTNGTVTWPTDTTLRIGDPIGQAIEEVTLGGPDIPDEIRAMPYVKVFTGPLRVKDITDGAEGQKVLHCTASSTIEDLHGDTMTEDCVRDMAQQAKGADGRHPMTIFRNHRYVVPDDVFGKTIAAQVLTRSTDKETGLPVWDMDLDIKVAGTNTKAIETWDLIKKDEVTLGVSIGGYILDYEFKDKDAGFWGGLNIKKMFLAEASIVGIPANQRSWVQNSVIAIGKSLGHPEKQIRKWLDSTKEAWDTAYINALPDSAFACIESGGSKDSEGKTTPRSLRHYPHHSKSGAVDMAHVNNALARMGDKSNYQCSSGETHLKAHQKSGKEAPPMDDITTPMDDITITPGSAVVGEAGLETTKRAVTVHKEGCDDDACDGSCREEEAAAPTTTTSESDPETEDTPAATEAAPEGESPAEGAPTDATDTPDGETTADAALTDEASDIALLLKDGQKATPEELLAALIHAAETLRAVRAEKSLLVTELETTKTERDSAKKDLEEATEIVLRIAKSPLGRKTQFAQHIGSFQSRFAGVYEQGFLKMLDEQE